MKILNTVFILLFFLSAGIGQNGNYWKIIDEQTIAFKPDTNRLPHKDNIEMSGKKVSAIIYYEIDKKGELSLTRDVIFPQLRTFNKTNEPDWKKYRAYFRRKADNKMSPTLTMGGKTIVPGAIDWIKIDGKITFAHKAVFGLKINRTLYPSMDGRYIVEQWTILNTNTKTTNLSVGNIDLKQTEKGFKGDYTFVINSNVDKEITLGNNQTYTFPVYYGALLNEEKVADFNYKKALLSRNNFLQTCSDNLVLKTPNKTLNTLFYFSKIRAAESIFESSMGLVHSPGGGNYYCGIWANDQVEYSGPFFPYMGYPTAKTAAFNTYKKFLENIPKDDHHIPYAFEVDGIFPMKHLDRGDAAMIAYGTSQYLLSSGDKKHAKTLWPLIDWSLEYCHRKRNAAGAIQSQSDEMEGRIPTGDANLSTSSLYYGGLKHAIGVAKSLGNHDKATIYATRLSEMENVIEKYFGYEIEGLQTYRYYDGNEHLRHWICLPLVMGITKRKKGTLNALFDKLWTDNGVLVEYNPDSEKAQELFWDRATLYTLRGALKTGDKRALEKLLQYSNKRLLGDHVPYPVEAYPENNMKHLSAESALYCRIFIEGLLGIEPTGFGTIKMTPRLPEGWNSIELNQVYLQGKPFDISIAPKGKKLKISIKKEGRTVFETESKKGKDVIFKI